MGLCGSSTAVAADPTAIVPPAGNGNSNGGKKQRGPDKFLHKGEGHTASTAHQGEQQTSNEMHDRAKKRNEAELTLREQIKRDKAAAKKAREEGKAPGSPQVVVLAK